MREVPPTAGLPPRWRDVLPSGRDFEADLAQYLGSPVQLTCSGTAALVIALQTLRRQSARRKVILPAYTCPLVALAILHCGLDAVPCDLAPDSFDLDPERLAALCDEDTLAVIATHLGGRVCALDAIIEIADAHGAQVIEDAAQALGATWQGRPVGLAGAAGFYSLAVGKGLTLYEGGVLLTHDAGLRQALREAATEVAPPQWNWEARRVAELLGYTAFYRPQALSLVYGRPLRRALRCGDLVGAVGDDFGDAIPLHALGAWRRAYGANALRRLPDFLAASQAQAQRRLAQLDAIAGVKSLRDTPGGTGVWPFFMLLLPSEHARDAALARLWQAGLGVSRLYIHALPDYAYLAGRLRPTDTPHARDFAARMLTVTNSPWLDDAGFEAICDVLREVTQPAWRESRD